MKILGFNFNKVGAEKMEGGKGEIKINTSINISKIEKIKSPPIKTKEEIFGVSFEYSINYDPSFAKLTFAGSIIISVDSKLAKEVEKDWKDKKMPEDFKMGLFNVIFRKANIKALQLEDELGLPLHLPMPTLKREEGKK